MNPATKLGKKCKHSERKKTNEEHKRPFVGFGLRVSEGVFPSGSVPEERNYPDLGLQSRPVSPGDSAGWSVVSHISETTVFIVFKGDSEKVAANEQKLK